MPNRIRELRKANEWKLEQLADRAGLGVTYLSDLERGERELSLTWMKRIAKALRVKPADLLTAADNSKSLSAEERLIVDLYNQADDRGRAQLVQMAKILVMPDKAA